MARKASSCSTCATRSSKSCAVSKRYTIPRRRLHLTHVSAPARLAAVVEQLHVLLQLDGVNLAVVPRRLRSFREASRAALSQAGEQESSRARRPPPVLLLRHNTHVDERHEELLGQAGRVALNVLGQRLAIQLHTTFGSASTTWVRPLLFPMLIIVRTRWSTRSRHCPLQARTGTRDVPLCLPSVPCLASLPSLLGSLDPRVWSPRLFLPPPPSPRAPAPAPASP